MAPAPHPVPPQAQARSAQGFPEAMVARALQAALAPGTGAVPVLGISGLQGTGKSTLADQIAALARARGLNPAIVSIDDFYLRKAEREALARDVHPLLATRGPPGTHDLPLALATLDRLRAGQPATIPRFDKLADDRHPSTQWERLDAAADVVVFEGWFLKAPPEAPPALEAPINTLEREEDPDGRWRRWCNDALARDYPALWRRIDRLLFLQPPDFEIVPEWRWQQECALQAKSAQTAAGARAGMSRERLERFVQHYERVSRQALRTLPAIAEYTIQLDAERRPLPG